MTFGAILKHITFKVKIAVATFRDFGATFIPISGHTLESRYSRLFTLTSRLARDVKAICDIGFRLI